MFHTIYGRMLAIFSLTLGLYIAARDRKLIALKTLSLSGILPGMTLSTTPGPLRIVDPECIHSLLLYKCPHLESLAIHWAPQVDPFLPKYLPTDTVPHLRSFTGPQDLVGLFASNRPSLGGGGGADGKMTQTSIETFMPVFRDILRSSVPALSLSLPSVLPPLDLLEAIVCLFTELRELSLTIFQPRPWWSGHLSSHPMTPLDTRRPELRDDALDNLPDQDISDAEEYAPQPIVAVEHRAHPEIVASTALHIGCTPDTILNWIACDRVSFPPLIEVLRFQVQEEVTVQPRVISHADQHRVIAALSHGYPHLREVQIGYPSNLWKRLNPGLINLYHCLPDMEGHSKNQHIQGLNPQHQETESE
ncbi:hypothetical protein B0H11DRAFT_1933169 [Mycena galericulata]|nr:hypothetical protein B0H11DRAFT_1933169 [Mycena galericulata]